MSDTRNTPLYIIAFLLFLSGIGYLCHSGFSENSIYFLNVAEAKATPSDKLANARLFGTVGTDGMRKLMDGAGISFHLQDKDNASLTILVNYSGVVPDTFKAGAEVIVEGGLDQSGHFAAKTLMTKCPSKYQKENRKG